MLLDRSSDPAGATPLARPRILLCSPDTVWLWPGTPLTEKRGGRTIPLPRSSLLATACMFLGPAANRSQIVSTVEHAAELLDRGRWREAQTVLDRAHLSPLSPDGAILMQAIAKRFGIAAPEIPVASGPRLWSPSNIEQFSRGYDAQYRAAAWLAPAFAKGDWDPQKHPRWPPGTPDSQGGRFAPANDGGSAPPIESPGTRPMQEAPNIGHNGGPPLLDEPPPEIPQQEPLTREIRNLLLRTTATWLGRQVLRYGVLTAVKRPLVVATLAAVAGASWLTYREYEHLQASLNPPQTLEQLQNAVNSHQPGTEIHHVNEAQKNSSHPLANAKRFPDRIESRANKVRIPYWAHRNISDWYSTPNPDFDGLTPRNWLRGKSWEKQYEVGLKALRKFGVLK